MMGLLYEKSILPLTGFSVTLQLLALPVLVAAHPKRTASGSDYPNLLLNRFLDQIPECPPKCGPLSIYSVLRIVPRPAITKICSCSDRADRIRAERIENPGNCEFLPSPHGPRPR